MADVVDVDEEVSEEEQLLRDGFGEDYYEFINSRRARLDAFQQSYDLTDAEMDVLGGFDDV